MITEGGYCPRLQAVLNTSEIMASPYSSKGSQWYCDPRAPLGSLTAEDIHGGFFFEHPIYVSCELNNGLCKIFTKMTNLLSNSEIDKSFCLVLLKLLCSSNSYQRHGETDSFCYTLLLKSPDLFFLSFFNMEVPAGYQTFTLDISADRRDQKHFSPSISPPLFTKCISENIRNIFKPQRKPEQVSHLTCLLQLQLSITRSRN